MEHKKQKRKENYNKNRERELALGRIYKKRYPEFNYFLHLKDSAKKRNIPFLLSFGEFLNLVRWYPVFFIRSMPRRIVLSIDRIENTKGYEYSNCQVLHVFENVQKKKYDKPRIKVN